MNAQQFKEEFGFEEEDFLKTRAYTVDSIDYQKMGELFNQGATYQSLVDYLVGRNYSLEAAEAISNAVIEAKCDNGYGDIGGYC